MGSEWWELRRAERERRRLARCGIPVRLRDRKPGQCRYCLGPLTGRQQSYCRPEHAHEFRILNEPLYARLVVLLRDKGRCAACGVETIAPEVRARIAPAVGRRAYHIPISPIRGWRSLFLTTWECDHVVELARGGTSELFNLQTLCPPCHRAKTARFARERAAERRRPRRVAAPNPRWAASSKP